MKRVTRAAGLLVVAAVASGCGIPTTGVVDAGEAATGVSTALRLYFVGDGGLQAVSRPQRRVDSLDAALKLLHEGPSEAERAAGLTTLVSSDLPINASGDGNRVTIALGEARVDPEETGLLGQLVCTAARTQSVLEDGVRPDDVQVTLASEASALGPYRCSYFLQGAR